MRWNSSRTRALLVLPIVGLAASLAATSLRFAPETATGHVGAITLTVSPLRAVAGGQLTSELTVSNRGGSADELDTALVSGGTPVSLAHSPTGGPVALQVCGGAFSPKDAERWMRDGPLVVPDPLVRHRSMARATILVTASAHLHSRGTLRITFYFARAGAVTVEVPVLAGRT